MKNTDFRPTTVNELFCWLENNIKPDTLLYETAHTYLEKERAAAKAQKKRAVPLFECCYAYAGKTPRNACGGASVLDGAEQYQF